MTKVIFYTTHCPKCTVLEKKLKEKNIDYIEFTNTEAMINLGLKTIPALNVNGEILDFPSSVKWINGVNE